LAVELDRVSDHLPWSGTLFRAPATSTGKRNSRNFYGVLKVVESDENDPDRHKLRLKHGSTDHGLQFVADDKRRMPESQVNPKPAKSPWLPADSTKPSYR